MAPPSNFCAYPTIKKDIKNIERMDFFILIFFPKITEIGIGIQSLSTRNQAPHRGGQARHSLGASFCFPGRVKHLTQPDKRIVTIDPNAHGFPFHSFPGILVNDHMIMASCAYCMLEAG
jgi:hypothetical protein